MLLHSQNACKGLAQDVQPGARNSILSPTSPLPPRGSCIVREAGVRSCSPVWNPGTPRWAAGVLTTRLSAHPRPHGDSRCVPPGLCMVILHQALPIPQLAYPPALPHPCFLQVFSNGAFFGSTALSYRPATGHTAHLAACLSSHCATPSPAPYGARRFGLFWSPLYPLVPGTDKQAVNTDRMNAVSGAWRVKRESLEERQFGWCRSPDWK